MKVCVHMKVHVHMKVPMKVQMVLQMVCEEVEVTFLLDESDLEEWSNQIRDEVRPLAIQTIPHLQHNLNH